MPTNLTHLESGNPAPDFVMPTSGVNETTSLNAYSGHYVVLYFYPKDATPGCTTEALDFTAQKHAFEALNASILGVSRDTVDKHNKFIAKKELGIVLGADTEGKVTKDYGVWVEKSMYGKTYMGIQRATFLIGPDGTLLKVWPKVRVKGHVDEVLQTLRNFSAE